MTDVAGLTSLGEHGPADTRSRDHHVFGSIVPWLCEDRTGTGPLEPGDRVVFEVGSGRCRFRVGHRP